MATCTSFFIVLSAFTAAVHGAAWEYWGSNGPDMWAVDYPDCQEPNQSPINIESSKAIFFNVNPFRMTGYSRTDANLSLINNGHTVQLNVGNPGYIYMSGGGLPGEKYVMDQLHFHWGNGTDGKGSEHTWDGMSFDAEIHFVHHDNVYATLGEAADKTPNGLEVLGVFVKADNYAKDHEGMAQLIQHFADVKYKGQETPITAAGFSVGKLLPIDHYSFYRYQGSLTTPPCFESVSWTVFTTPITISQTQMSEFRALMGTEMGASTQYTINYNYRPTVPLAGRNVYISVEPPNAARACMATYSVTVMSLLFCNLIVYLIFQ